MSDEIARESVAEAIALALQRDVPAAMDDVPPEVWNDLADAAIAVARPLIERAFLEQLIVAAKVAEGWVRAHPDRGETEELAPYIGDWLRRFMEPET